MIKYIVIIKVFNSEEVYYCKNISEVKEITNRLDLDNKERNKIRVFKIETEINCL